MSRLENVFICVEDETVIVKESKSEKCPVCDYEMENAGWFETGQNGSEACEDAL